MTKKIILVHPPMYLQDIYGKLAAGGSELPPQGICLVAAVLREHGFRPIIIDASAEKLSLKETLKRIEAHLPAVFVGFSVYFISEEIVAKLGSSLKKSHPEQTIVIGGGHVTTSGLNILKKYQSIDVGVVGEGEITTVKLAQALTTKKSLDFVKGIIFRKKGKVVQTPLRPLIKNLDDLPFPAWDLLPQMTKYYQPAADSLKKWPSTVLITSRGCPGHCFFCNKNAFGNKVRQNSPPYVIEEMKTLHKNYGINDIFIQDDTFFANRDWVVEFCQRLVKEKLAITWSCHGRTDLVDLPLLKLMKKAGCWQIGFGLESGSQKVLDAINKQNTVECNKKALAMCQKAGLAVKGLFMVGSFGETKKTLEQTKKFIQNNYLTDFHATFFMVVPGTVATKIWPKFGRIEKPKILAMSSRPSFVPFGLTKEELIQFHKDLYFTFYARPKIWWYFFKKMKSPYIRKKLFRSALALFDYLSPLG